MTNTIGDAQIFLIGLLLTVIFIGIIVAVLMKFNASTRTKLRRRPHHMREMGTRETGETHPDLSGGRDVSAALGVQQSTGLKIAKGPTEDETQDQTRKMY